MNWRTAFFSQLIVPLAGGAVLGYGIYRVVAVPTSDRIAAAHAEAESVRGSLAELRVKPIVEPERFAEQIPESIELAQVLKEVHGFAEQCDLRSIRFQLDAEDIGDQGAPDGDAGATEEVVPLGGDVPGVTPAPAAAARKAEVVPCKFEVEATYESLVRFMGLIESMEPLARVSHLDIKPGPVLVVAEAVVLFHYLPPAPAQEEPR